MEFAHLVLPPFINLIVILLATLLVWFGRGRIRAFLDELNIRSVEVSGGGVRLERFERKVSEAYTKQGLDPPSEQDRTDFRSIVQDLAPYASDSRSLWVDNHPSNNRLERAAFVDLQIDVQACRSTEEALAELNEDPYGCDLVISDWTRGPPREEGVPEGLRLLREMRSSEMPIKAIPLIFYHGVVSQAEQNQRRKATQEHGATGATNRQALLDGTTATT
jgi:CheY-like chemotaxis protein